MSICRQKINFIPHVYLEILQRHANFLFWVFGHAWLRTSKMIVSTCRTLIYLHAKNKLISHLFYKILHFKESWPISPEPEFCSIWDWRLNIDNNISFRFRLFPGKTNEKFFKKIKKPYLETILGPFSPNLSKNEFDWKKGYVSF